jgi:hypothetical protein
MLGRTTACLEHKVIELLMMSIKEHHSVVVCNRDEHHPQRTIVKRDSH